MKGLLIKDIRLMKGQSTILLALLILVAVFTGVVSDVSPSFVVAYITIFLSIFVASTISYDEYDHGYLFCNKAANPEYLLSFERCPFHTETPDHYALVSHLIDLSVSQSSALMPLHSADGYQSS